MEGRPIGDPDTAIGRSVRGSGVANEAISLFPLRLFPLVLYACASGVPNRCPSPSPCSNVPRTLQKLVVRGGRKVTQHTRSRPSTKSTRVLWRIFVFGTSRLRKGQVVLQRKGGFSNISPRDRRVYPMNRRRASRQGVTWRSLMPRRLGSSQTLSPQRLSINRVRNESVQGLPRKMTV